MRLSSHLPEAIPSCSSRFNAAISALSSFVLDIAMTDFALTFLKKFAAELSALSNAFPALSAASAVPSTRSVVASSPAGVDEGAGVRVSDGLPLLRPVIPRREIASAACVRLEKSSSEIACKCPRTVVRLREELLIVCKAFARAVTFVGSISPTAPCTSFNSCMTEDKPSPFSPIFLSLERVAAKLSSPFSAC